MAFDPNDLVLSFVTTKNEILKSLGAYPDRPKVPVLTLNVAIAVQNALTSATSSAQAIASSVPGDVDKSLASSWRRFSGAMKATTGAMLVQAMEAAQKLNPAPGALPQVLVSQVFPKTVFPSDLAEKFWDEADRMAIALKVVLDRPFESRWSVAWGAVGQAFVELPKTVSSAIEATVAFTSEIVASVAAGVAKGTVKGTLRGLGPIVSIVLIGGGVWWLVRKYRSAS